MNIRERPPNRIVEGTVENCTTGLIPRLLTISTGSVSDFCTTVPAARPIPERVHFQDTMRKSSEDLDPFRIRIGSGRYSTWLPPAFATGGLFLSIIRNKIDIYVQFII